MDATTTDACARTLRDAILRGAFPPGVRLPTERALADQFGLNRATVRGALARLEAEHLVSPRQGSGYTVHDFRREAGPDLIAAFAALAEGETQRTAIVRDLLLVRRQLARAVLERLVGSTNEAGLAGVEWAIDAFERIAHGRATAGDLARADLDVAAALVAATRSTVLQLCLNPIASLLARLPDLERAMYREPLSNVLAYRAVLAWARAGRIAGIDALLRELAERDEATLAALATNTKKNPDSPNSPNSPNKKRSRR